MYKCRKCGASSEPNKSKLVITEHHMIWDEKQEKELRQIKSETPVCPSCKAEEKTEGPEKS